MDSDVMMATYEFLLDKGNIIIQFSVWLRNRLRSSGLESVFIHTEQSL